MKRFILGVGVAALLAVPVCGLTQVVEKDEHVNCSTPERDCSIDVTWEHRDGFIVRDERRKNNSPTDKEIYSIEHILEYYSRFPKTLKYDDPALVKWAVENLFGIHQEFAESGESQSINYESGGKYYSEECNVQSSARMHSVEHTYEVDTQPYQYPKPNVLNDRTKDSVIEGTQMRSTRSADGKENTEYYVWERFNNRYRVGFARSKTSTADKARCSDPNFPFGLLKTNPLLPPK